MRHLGDCKEIMLYSLLKSVCGDFSNRHTLYLSPRLGEIMVWYTMNDTSKIVIVLFDATKGK